jgi:putative ABC transport system permease protein
MIDNRWKKLLRDFTSYQGRALALLIALTAGVASIATMFGAYGIIEREAPLNYAMTNPAHVTIDVNEVTPAILDAAKRFNGVAAAEARAVIEARARVGDEWMRMLLFVVEDFDALRLNTFARESGAWPPPGGSMLIERQATDFLQKTQGQSLTVRMPRGATLTLPISGVVHDTTVAPAWQEQTGYGYVTRATLIGLGYPVVMDELRVLFAGAPETTAEIDARALDLAGALQSGGAHIHSVKVPPLGQHPHQGLLASGLRNYVTLALFSLVLAAVLVAAVLSSILARQVREIGVMKTIGAQSGQIARMYAALTLMLGGASVVVGLPLGIYGADRLARVIADTMNFTVTSAALPIWVYALVVAVGLLVPLLVSIPTIVRASRITIREALGSVGLSANFGSGRFDRALACLGGFGLTNELALRNIFRRRGRLALSLALLAGGGGLFITALNARDGWQAIAERVKTDRFYHADFRLLEPVAEDRIAKALASVNGVRSYEVWDFGESAFSQEGRIDVMRTYPDRGHGSFSLYGIPPQTRMIKFSVVAGRWLADDDDDAVVLTQKTFNEIPGAKIGDRTQISVNGRSTSWRIAGVVQEVGGAGGYVSRAGFAKAMSSQGTGGDIRLIASGTNAEEHTRVVRQAETALDDAGIAIERSMPLDRMYAALAGHMEVPSRMLMLASLVIVLVGGLGLASMMTINVLERTREIGVMKAIGATPRTVIKMIAGEALFVAGASWILSMGLSLLLIRVLGPAARAAHGASLPNAFSLSASAFWLVLVVAIALVASAAPAARAGKLVVREALAHE